MGLHLNWLAVQSGDKAALLARLGFREVGSASDEMRSKYACAVLPSGWTVIVSAEMALKLERLLPLASQGGLALGCEVSETVMFSRVQAYRGGEMVWRVAHDAEQDPEDLSVAGEPPAELTAIRARLTEQQAAEPDEPVDFLFDAPVELAQAVCGYSASSGPAAIEWTILAMAADTRGALAADLSRSLSAAIRSDLMPLLTSAGWESGADRPDWPGGLDDVTRIHDGRFQVLWFTWKNEGADAYFLPRFAVWRGPERTGEVLVSGAVAAPAASLGKRLAAGLRQLTKPPPTPDARLAEVLEGARLDLATLDRFLTDGEPGARLHITHGSAADLRSTTSG